MTKLQTLKAQEAELLSGGNGGCCKPPSSNPSHAYEIGCEETNYGQAKKFGFEGANPSEIYCELNYGQSKKD